MRSDVPLNEYNPTFTVVSSNDVMSKKKVQ